MGFFIVLKAEVVRSWTIMRRYWFATLTSIIVGYSMMVGMIFVFFQSPDAIRDYLGETLDKVIGFLIGIFGFSIVGLFTQGLQGMARTGELEQVCMSPHGLIVNFLARSFVSSVMSILSSALMVYLVAATFDGKLYFAFIPTVTVLFLTYINLMGFGFMSGGLVLIFKQVGQLAMIVRLGLIGVAMTASAAVYDQGLLLQAFLHLLPITDAAICLKLLLLEGRGYGVFAHPSFYFLIGNCVLWTAIGFTAFRYMENWSRDKGTLGAY